MAEAWESYPRAPARGTHLAWGADVPDGGTSSVEIGGFPILLLRTGGDLRAFVNACPHQFLPLDTRSTRVLSPDGTVLRCSNHDAGFDAETGEGIDGFGQGCRLDPVPVAEGSDGIVRISRR